MRMILFLSLGFLLACNETPKETSDSVNLPSLADSVAAYNHQIVRTEIQEIDDFIKRYQWEMKKTQTGLRYMIYRKGDGIVAKPGDLVGIKYKLSLLNGDLVYQSDANTLFTFEIGKRNVVNGLEEGVMLMSKGGKAKLIVPSHLAFGLLGDMEKVPARATLIYDVELCSINQPKK